MNAPQFGSMKRKSCPARPAGGVRTTGRPSSVCRRTIWEELARRVLESDLLVLATPIYSWYCTPPMKAALDRLVYGLNKYYGERRGPSLWAGKRLALITTCGYRPERGADLWEEGMRRYCKHSGLRYQGMLAERHLGYNTVFFDGEKERRAREFARKLSVED